MCGFDEFPYKHHALNIAKEGKQGKEGTEAFEPKRKEENAILESFA